MDASYSARKWTKLAANNSMGPNRINNYFAHGELIIPIHYLDFPFLIRTKTKIYFEIAVVLLFNLLSHPNKNNPRYKCRVSLWKWPKTCLARPPRFSGSSSTSRRCRPSTHRCRRSVQYRTVQYSTVQLHQPQVPAQYTQVSQVRHQHAKLEGSRRFHNDREGSYRAFSWLEAPTRTSTFTFKTLLRHYAKQVLTHGQ